MIAPVRDVLRSLDPDLPFIEVRRLGEKVEASLCQERLLAWLSTIFGAVAALLASIGLCGTLDCTRDIGVRMAFGAQPAKIIGLLSREILLLIGSGTALGLCTYAAVALSIRRVLYDVRSCEPIALASALPLVGLIAVAATAPAAYRALRIDPAAALRAE